MDNFFLMKSHLTPVVILTSYFAVFKWGPIFLKDRKAYNLKSTLVVYNLSQIFCNFYLFIRCNQILSVTGLFCTSKYTSSPDLLSMMLDLHHYYILLKGYDLLDTVFYVLRKKDSQLSFLHLYHHVNMFAIVWLTGKYFPATTLLPAGPPILFGWWNTMVHTIMYTYYMLSALGSSVKSSWWKKYITLLQLLQHCSLFLLGTITLTEEGCPYPKILTYIFLVLGGILIYLFGVFYVKTYVRSADANGEKAKLGN